MKKFKDLFTEGNLPPVKKSPIPMKVSKEVEKLFNDIWDDLEGGAERKAASRNATSMMGKLRKLGFCIANTQGRFVLRRIGEDSFGKKINEEGEPTNVVGSAVSSHEPTDGGKPKKKIARRKKKKKEELTEVARTVKCDCGCNNFMSTHDDDANPVWVCANCNGVSNRSERQGKNVKTMQTLIKKLFKESSTITSGKTRSGSPIMTAVIRYAAELGFKADRDAIDAMDASILKNRKVDGDKEFNIPAEGAIFVVRINSKRGEHTWSVSKK